MLCGARVQACARSLGNDCLNRPVEADDKEIPVNSATPQAIRAYLARLEQASAFEIEELRRTPAALKVRQIWSLMSCADVLEDPAEREASLAEVRDRWRRIRRAFFFVTEPVPQCFLGALSDLREWLDNAGFPAMIVGGVAASILGRPRATRESPEGRGAQLPDRPVSNKSLQPAGRHADFGQFIPITR